MNLFKYHAKKVLVEDSLFLNPESSFQAQPQILGVILSAKFSGDSGSALNVLELLGLQKPQLTNVKKGNLNLSLRKGEVTGCKLHLRGNTMYNFLDRFVFEILPSVKKLNNLTISKNSLNWHFSDVFVLDDINNHYIYLQGLRSLDIVIQTKNAYSSFYEGCRFPLKKKLKTY